MVGVVAGPLPGGLGARSDPLPLSQPPQSQLSSPSSPTPSSPLASPVTAPPHAAQLPPAAPSGAVLPPAARSVSVTSGPNAHLEHSGPPPPPHEPLTQSDSLLDVTYIHPQPTLEMEPLTPAVPTPEVTMAGVVAGPFPGGLVACSDPLPLSQPPTSQLSSPSSPPPSSPLASPVTAPPHAAQLPPAALSGAVLPSAAPSISDASGPNAHLEQSGPPSPPHEPLTRADSLLDVTYIHPQPTLEMEPLTPAVPSPEAARDGVVTGPFPDGPTARTDPLQLTQSPQSLPSLPPSPLPPSPRWRHRLHRPPLPLSYRPPHCLMPSCRPRSPAFQSTVAQMLIWSELALCHLRTPPSLKLTAC